MKGQIDIFSLEKPQFKIDKPVRLIELFAGIGAQAMAMRDLGIDFEKYRTSEWKISSVMSYKAIHEHDDNTDYSKELSVDKVTQKLFELGISADGVHQLTYEQIKRHQGGEKWKRDTYNAFMATHNIGSIVNRHGKDLGITDTDKYDYLMTYSFPCLVGDTSVLTDKGTKYIKDIIAGDRVLTHKGTYENVLASSKTGHKEIWEIRCKGFPAVRCTANHKFYARKCGETGYLEEPGFVECEKLSDEWYVGTIAQKDADYGTVKNAINDGIYIWMPVISVVNTKKAEDVYDIEVENAHSFTANGIIVHNCQDLSVAGKQRGMAKGSGTRSGLLWEVERLLNETDELPQILLMENVPQVHSKTAKKKKDENGNDILDERGKPIYEKSNYDNFMDWIAFLESKGYSNYWQDLNSKNYGVAQNRNRCFMVSILGNYSYMFPEPIPLTKTMKDYLEDTVDEKYYIKNEKAAKLIQKLIDNGTLADKKTEQVCTDLTTAEPKEKTVANCITAKDRSISNQLSTGNGVVKNRDSLL